MHTTQHLPEREIKCAQAALSGWRFIITGVIANIALMVMHTRVVCLRITARMPGGMYDSALLRYQQQQDTEIMN